MISKEIAICHEDMCKAAETGRISLEAQVRVYDLIEKIFQIQDLAYMCPDREEYSRAVKSYTSDYKKLSSALDSTYDEALLLEEAENILQPYRTALAEAALRSEKTTALHVCAKETYEIWQKNGLFARHRALRRLRALAGFRLESNRIGNYVAKTFDLKNEADALFARAQQSMYAANVSYKIKPGLYAHLASLLEAH